ncbi:MAG: ASKHA domain-containing protein, partial [Candidatus Korobacteraceae bacterium]
ERGTALQTILAMHGVEFPCGGSSNCGGCRVQVIEGRLKPTAEDKALFSEEELAVGWRLACRACAEGPLKLKVDQWTMPILADNESPSGARRKGLAMAIDLGTTTIVAQLLDLESGKLLGLRSALNPQAAHGADLISRVRFALDSDVLTSLIREFLGVMVHDLATGREDEIVEVVLVGNAVMHHLFCGLDVKPLSHAPFESPNNDEQRFTSNKLKWKLPGSSRIRFLPSIGAFVGSDILAGIVAVRLGSGRSLRALIDLGTNGEIALGNEQRILCASTAAGTAFEAGSITMGMRAATGAISRVFVDNAKLRCSVIGNAEPRGICGSGLVDAVAAGLDTGAILPNGRLANGAREFPITGDVRLSQHDIRQLQLAKGAIATGLRILLKRWGAGINDIAAVYLSGAFGNYVRPESAVRIGLLETPLNRLVASGNTALRGAKFLIGEDRYSALDIIEHVSLASDPQFQNTFIASLAFPQPQAGMLQQTFPSTSSLRGDNASGSDRM